MTRDRDTEASPSLMNGLGLPERRREHVALTVVAHDDRLLVECEHADEVLQAIRFALPSDSWLECRSPFGGSSIVQLRYVIRAEVVTRA